MTFRVLFVCTGNVCRSPAAELIAGAVLPAGAPVALRSAGIGALIGEPVDPPTAAALQRRGIDPSEHRGRQFEPRMAANADLILVAERAHRDAVLTAVPRALRRTFSIAEFARLTAGVTPASATPAEIVAAAAARREQAPQDTPAITADDLWPDRPGAKADPDDIPDPYRRSWALADRTVEQIAGAVVRTLTVLGLTQPPRPQRPRPAPVPHRPRPGSPGLA